MPETIVAAAAVEPIAGSGPGTGIGPRQAIEKPIIFFDGVCGMCNALVNIILRIDSREQFLFAPLQGETGKKLLPPLPPNPRDWSMMYLDEKGTYDKSDAVLQIFRRLGGVWWFFSLARCVPRFIRNPLYRLIAINRYKIFGEKDSCRIPTPAERRRFLP